MSDRVYLVAVNDYRSSTSNGFANTWSVYRVKDAAAQRAVLTNGLPVSDYLLLANDGTRSVAYSTVGIRPVDAAERRKARKELAEWGRLPWLTN